MRSNIAFYSAVLEDHERALYEISKAREIAPKDPSVLLDCIKVFELTNQRDKAIQSLQELIELGGSMEEADWVAGPITLILKPYPPERESP